MLITLTDYAIMFGLLAAASIVYNGTRFFYWEANPAAPIPTEHVRATVIAPPDVESSAVSTKSMYRTIEHDWANGLYRTVLSPAPESVSLTPEVVFEAAPQKWQALRFRVEWPAQSQERV